MLKPLPALDEARLLPPVGLAHYGYFANAADHPFEPAASGPSLRHAWWLAECALAAYADPGEAAAVFGLAGLRVAGGGPVTGARFGGQCYVVADDETIIIAFRGTQVVKTADWRAPGRFQAVMKRVLRDLATDAKTRLVPWPGPAGGRVHQGFSDSLHELLPGVAARLEELRAERPARRLWLTGHSLGAALATLAADRLAGVCGIHVFGSPRVGDATFAANVVFPGWRFRHHTDAIPWVPLETMGFAHVPCGRYLDRHAAVRHEPDQLGLWLDAAAGAPAAMGQAWSALRRGEWAALTPRNFIDHAPLVYAVRLWNAYVRDTGHGD